MKEDNSQKVCINISDEEVLNNASQLEGFAKAEESGSEFFGEELEEIDLSDEESPSQHKLTDHLPKKYRMAFVRILMKYWFFAGLAIAITAAYFFPEVGRKGGYIYPEYTMKVCNSQRSRDV